MYYYFMALKKAFDFKSRSSRKEFWMFSLYNGFFIMLLLFFGVVNVAALRIGSSLHNDTVRVIPVALLCLYGLAVILPALAITIRRLHDSGRSGFWIFINLIPFVGGIWFFVMLLLDSQKESNKYGENVKEPSLGTPSPVGLIVVSLIWIAVVIIQFKVVAFFMAAVGSRPASLTSISLLLPAVILICGLLFLKIKDTQIPGVLLGIGAVTGLVFAFKSFLNILGKVVYFDTAAPAFFQILTLAALVFVALSWIIRKKVYHAAVTYAICSFLWVYIYFIEMSGRSMYYALPQQIIFFIMPFIYLLLAGSLFPAKKLK